MTRPTNHKGDASPRMFHNMEIPEEPGQEETKRSNVTINRHLTIGREE